jgi:hydrogenase nickel incorporation protein HypA/HybF
VLKHTEGRNVQKIVRIHLRIGELSDLEDEWMQHYFNYLGKGTLAEKAILVIKRSPIRLRCRSCANLFEINKQELGSACCPNCGDKRPAFVSGREYFIENMEVI